MSGGPQVASGPVQSRANPEHTLVLLPETLDKSKHYRWVREDLVQRRMIQGYRLVSRAQDKVKTLLDEVEKPTDDRIRNGDAVLMCCDVRTVEQRRADRRAMNELRLTGPKNRFKNEARGKVVGGKRVQVIEEPDDEEED